MYGNKTYRLTHENILFANQFDEMTSGYVHGKP